MHNLLPFESVEPKQPADALVIWLHGLGADGYDFLPIVPALKLDDLAIRFILPHAPTRPVTLNRGHAMPAWFDIYEISPAAKQDEAGIQLAYEQICALMAAQHDQGIAYNRMVLIGFSQGGALALYSALRAPHTLAGVAGLSTYLPISASLKAHLAQPNHLPIFLAHGVRDSVVPIEAGIMTNELLESLHYPCLFHTYNMEHQVCPLEIKDLSTWLRKILKP